MRIQLVIRLILAFIFATFAAIYSQLIPSLLGERSFIIRVLLTLAAGALGYLVFPAIAKAVVKVSMTTFNFVVHRLSFEVSRQINRHPATPVGPLPARPLILDTSAIIDGRILDIARAGFLSGLIIVPSFVLTELQQVADSADGLKRARGRRGFEVIEALKKTKDVQIQIWEREQNGKMVDEKLLKLAKALNGRIITTDFNLNKLASVWNISVLNVNNLSNAVKTVSLPGENFEIKVVHLGKENKQGVGYLEDGTMVVVAGSADKIGQMIQVEVTKSIQTPAGRMIFAQAV